MTPKEVVFSPNAERDIKKLSAENRKLVIDGIESWQSQKTKPAIEKIKSQPDFFRLRLGRFRIIYYPLSNERVVLLLIRDRKDAYSGLDRLPKKLETAMRKLHLGGR